MKPIFSLTLLAGCLGLLVASCQANQPGPQPTLTVESSPTSTPLPAPTATLQPSPTPTPARPTPSPRPTQPFLDWKVPAHHYDWPGPARLGFSGWIGEGVIKVPLDDGYSTTYQLELDSHNNFSEPTLVGQGTFNSPNGKYYLESNSGGLDLYRAADRQLVSHSDLTLQGNEIVLNYNAYAKWKADDSALLFVQGPSSTTNPPTLDTLFYWKTDGSQPRFLTQIKLPWFAISPNLEKVAAVVAYVDPPSANTAPGAVIDILDLPTGKKTTLRIENLGWEVYLSWLNDNVLTLGLGRNDNHYFDIKTGKYLFDFYNAMNCCGFHQYPAVSPNQRWVTLDHNAEVEIFPKRYSLYDLTTRTETVLSNTLNGFISFGRWKADSSVLYLVNAPAKIGVPPDSSLPAGLLAYDPLLKKATVLVPEAVRAYWSPDARFAWVLRQGPPAGEVTASLLDAAAGTLQGEVHLSNTPIQGDPAGDFLQPYSLQWSPDSTHVLLNKDRDELWLLTGTQATLAATGFKSKHAYWSPGGRYFLVNSGLQIWVVDVNEIQ